MYNLRMKLICLNLWGGTLLDQVLDFIKYNSIDTDIFCFQEVYKSSENKRTPSDYQSNLIQKLTEALSNYNFHFSPQFHGRDFHFALDYPISQGVATFWKNSLNPIDKGEIFIYGEENKFIEVPGKNQIIPSRNMQYVEFEKFIVTNLHGYWAPLPKYDTPQRIKQSEIIIDFFKKINKPAILTGDFNLGINTRSVLMIEENGFTNLIKKSKAPTTRSYLYNIKWRANDKFADYIFTKNVDVRSFEVMKDKISDHLPLKLEFQI